MRISLTILAAAGSLSVSHAAPVSTPSRQPAATGNQACPPLTRHARGSGGAIVRKLTEAPPADLHHAVDRRVGRCPVPALVPGGRAR